MEWLNYHHLHYFWVVACEGSIARASTQLSLAQPTISGQIHALEEALGEQLFARVGRHLVLTDVGRLVFRYADEIFTLGRELMDTLKGRPTGRPLRLIVGVADVLPKLIAYRLLEPALHLSTPVQVICREGKLDRLLAELAVYELDVVLSDAPSGSMNRVRAFNHLLGECGMALFGTAELAARYRPGFPASLDGAPFLLPTDNTMARRALEQWFNTVQMRPHVVGEFEDSALLNTFGQTSLGIFAAPSVITTQVQQQYGVEVIGHLDEVRERFYAIAVERKLKHPAIVALTEMARQTLFGETMSIGEAPAL
ncbi:MAG: transcriptional activator NhaR [Candidatus Tectomicrobia bacterium]|uniref:Transcriptional activator NhaR n=1 Tax=Tectimicrobiota bacterium TaxID=2528274 RepID=A0A937W135_UNCTE|nr:transcriptional activator NhaR [Candidatus Tectomicrobia bacterium]